MNDEIYIIKPKESPWGDYGDALVHGMSAHLPRIDGNIQLERAGPFVPNVMISSVHDIIVSDDIKQFLDLELTLRFKEVIKTKIVELKWHLWDFEKDEPEFYPDSGEPEDYILTRRHNEKLSDDVGLLWEIIPDIVTKIQMSGGDFNRNEYSGQHFVCADEFGGYAFISKKLKTLLESFKPEWVAFEKIT